MNNCSIACYACAVKAENELSETTANNVAAQRLCREGEYWTLDFDNQQIRLRDRKGLRYLAVLLQRPAERIPVLRLVQVVEANRSLDGDGSEELALQKGAATEAARVRVTRALLTALRQIRIHHYSLGQHLFTTVRTGAACSYTPDTRLPTRWKIESSIHHAPVRTVECYGHRK